MTTLVSEKGLVPAIRPQIQPQLPPVLDLPALNALRGQRIILASASPRRRHLLAQLGLRNLDIVPSKFKENLSHSLGPLAYVLQTATKKAEEVYAAEINNEAKGEPALLIAADTIVVSAMGAIIEKPRGEAHHFAVLKQLRDEREHRVYTAVVVMRPLESAVHPGYRMETTVEETKIFFDPNVSDDLLRTYVKTGEGNDKAGGYGMQGMGAILVEGIEGTFDNGVGLPVRATLQLIEKVMEPEHDDDDDLVEPGTN